MKIKVQMQPALTGAARNSAAETSMKCFLKAAEHGYRATRGPFGAFFVPSSTQPRIARTLSYSTGVDGVVWVSCSCPSGFWRGEGQNPSPINCWHGAALLTLLAIEGRVTVRNNLVVLK